MLEQRSPESSEAQKTLETECTLCQYSKETRSAKKLLDDVEDASQLSQRLNELPPTKRSNCIAALILRATRTPGKKGLLMLLPEPIVLDILEETRDLLEGAKGCVSCTTDPEQRTHPLRRLLITLSRNTQVVPRSFIINGVQLQDRDAVSGGGFADIFRASYQGQHVALKRLRNFRDSPVSVSEENAFRREALVSWFLDHPNIQSFVGIDQTTFSPLLCIVSPWQQNGNILIWLTHCDTLGLPILVDEHIRRILLGLGYLHDNGIIHGDLRGANVLIDEHCNPKLADFGLSTLYGAGSSTMGGLTGGTTRFMAPELLLGEGVQVSFSADMYAFACLCIELHTREHPFPNITFDYQVISAVSRGSCPSIPSEPPNSLDGFWETLEQCWNRDPLMRPSVSTLVSSLPLRRPLYSPRNPTALRHVNWTIPTSESPALKDSPIGHHLHQELTYTLDSCLLGLLDLSAPLGKSVDEVLERLTSLGCPGEMNQYILEGLADGEVVASEPSQQTQTTTDTHDGDKLHAHPTNTAGVGLPESAPVEVAVGPTAEYAALLHDRGRHASEDGDHKAAAGYHLQAARIQRDLAQEKPEEFNPLLALSLHNLASSLAELGEYKDAVTYGRQAVDLRRDLAREKPDEFNPLLALSLHNLASSHVKLEELNDSVTWEREAVDLRRELARDKPDVFNHPLAISLQNLAYCLGRLEQYKDAVMHGQKAVDLHRDLARDKPDTFNRFLALSLQNLAHHHSRLGDYQGAVTCGQKAINLNRDLARGKPDEFNSLLVMSLRNLAQTHSEVGEFKEAITYIREAVDILRGLSRQNPDKFNLEFVQALGRLTSLSAKAGQHTDVLKFGREVTALYRIIAHDRPEESRWLVTYLRLLRPSLIEHGFWIEVQQVGEEAKRVEKSLKALKKRRYGIKSLLRVFRGTHSG